VSEQKRSDQARIVSEERFRLLVESAPDAIFVQTQGSFAYLNSAAVKLFGADSADDLSGSPVIEHVHQDYRKSVAGRIALLNREKRPVPSEHELFLRMDGTSVDVEASAVPMNYKGNDGALVFARDTSARIMAEKEQRKLQDQLFQAQKMESIGRLAGGVAHDYNNFLGVIIGYTELSLMQLNPGDEMHKNLQEVLNAANRSKAVTRQLLAFARKEAIAPEVLDLNATVEGLLKMIRRLIGENIELTWRPRVGLWAVEMDPSQIDQILVNLCVNARDAIVDVGKILIETDNGTIDEDYRIQHDSIVPGDYVTLAISDNGSGMLGLSTVYGIVKQNNGFINVYSEPGHGTHFKIYLPKCARGLVEGRKAGLEEIPSGRGETILVVEDEVAILGLTKKILQRCGYNVLAAATPTEAIALAKGQAGSISLLITDVIMPEMNGRDLVEKLKKISPGLNYLFMSGYPADVIAPSGVLEAGVQFIQKPFSAKNLAVKIREILRNAY
ncbi:MAG: PAS domain S-box protein, partial [Desulfobacterales bacterium]|nr:PAS domain S-box protein [Desulfobacterales bacterium]